MAAARKAADAAPDLKAALDRIELTGDESKTFTIAQRMPMCRYLDALDIKIGRSYQVQTSSGDKAGSSVLTLEDVVALEGGFETTLVFSVPGMSEVVRIRWAQIETIVSGG